MLSTIVMGAMQYLVEKHGDGWVVLAEGFEQLVCERKKMALKITRNATILLQLDKGAQRLKDAGNRTAPLCDLSMFLEVD